MPYPMSDSLTVELIPQYKQGDMIVLTKFKPEWGFGDDQFSPKINTPYKVRSFNPEHQTYIHDQKVKMPAVTLDYMDGVDYQTFANWWIPCEIIAHAKNMKELTDFIKDKIKAVKGA